MAEILVIVADGAEEIETMAVADVLVRAGHNVTMAAGEKLQVTGSRGLPMAASVTLRSLAERAFDLVYIPGGIRQAEFCRDNSLVQERIAAQLSRSDAWLAIICAAPIALLPQGLARGRRLTSHPAKQKEMAAQATWTGQRIERDGNLITSQGPGTAIELGLYLVRLLGSQEQADEIADAMLAAPPDLAHLVS